MRNHFSLLAGIAMSGLLLTGCSDDKAKAEAAPTPVVEPAETTSKADTPPAETKRELKDTETIDTSINDKNVNEYERTTTLSDPGLQDDLSQYRVMNSTDDYFYFLYGLRDWEVKATEVQPLINHNNPDLKSWTRLKNSQAFEQDVFVKAEKEQELEALFAKILEEHKVENNLIKIIIPAHIGFKPYLQPYDMESKTFIGQIPGFNHTESVDNYLEYTGLDRFAVINAGDFMDYKVEDLEKAKAFEAQRNEGVQVVVYGYVSEVKQDGPEGVRRTLKIAPHRVEIQTQKGEALLTRSI